MAVLVQLAVGVGRLATVQAQSLEALRAAQSRSADPNTSAFGLSYRSAARAQLGASLPIYMPETSGAYFSLAPLVELHEPRRSPQVLPSEYWRARLAVSGGAFWQDDFASYLVTLGLEHESDHETAHAYSQPGFLAENAIAIDAIAGARFGEWSLYAAPMLRLYVASCTRDRSQCRNFRGDDAFGAQLDLTLEAPELGWAVIPFASASGFVVAAHAAVRGESHLELHLGLSRRSRWLLMQLFGLGYFGNDVGITRGERLVEFGLGLRFDL
ncbi:MAG TPA: hypothetical protein VHZ95_21525 [Polyangiales bacterium]|nr:hypothetical protein [Polyangiales bacterium]